MCCFICSFLQGLGTDDDTLMRVIISRCEVDMMEIKTEFQPQYNQTLGKFIAVSVLGERGRDRSRGRRVIGGEGRGLVGRRGKMRSVDNRG